MTEKKPNVILVFGDQWRAQALGYAGDPNVQTPHLDGLAAESLNFRNAVSGCPVCCPARASLLTGQSPLEHRVIVNDVPLRGTFILDAQHNVQNMHIFSDIIGQSVDDVLQMVKHF